MEGLSAKSPSAKVSIVGLFAVITFVLTLPIALLLSQNRQDLRGKAAEPSPTPRLIQSSMSGFISGYVYYDTNKNAERDSGESPYPGAKVKVTQIKDQSQQQEVLLTTDASGYFKFNFSTQGPNLVTYMVTLVPPDGFKTINTNPVKFFGPEIKTREVVEFGLIPLSPSTIIPTIKPSATPTPTEKLEKPKPTKKLLPTQTSSI